jgi:selenocysteine-specific elongation factor
VERREVVELDTLRRIGVTDSAEAATVVRAGSWLMSADRAQRARDQILQAVTAHDRARPLDRGLPLTVLAERLALPSPELVAAVVRAPLKLIGGRVLAPGDGALPAEVEQALAALADDLADSPFSAPTADRLRDLGLDVARIAAAAKAGRLLRLAPGVVLLPGADAQAVEVLSDLPQPFTTSEARSRLGTSRRVVLPLLEHLDRARLTRRLPDDRRLVL